MSLAVLGGIGRGLQEGSQFVRQRRMDDATLDLRNQQLQLQKDQLAQQTKESDARLSLLNEEAGWKRTDRAAAENELKRKSAYNNLYGSVVKELGPDADPLNIRATVGQRWAESGLAKAEEMEPLLTAASDLRKRGLMQAFETGDIATIETALSKQSGKPMKLAVRQTKDALGLPDRVFSVLGPDGKPVSEMSEAQLGMLIGVDRMAQKKAQAELVKTASEVQENKAQASAAQAAAGASSAQAGKYRAETTQTDLENEGLRALDPKVRGTKAGAGSETPDMKNAKFMVQVGLAATPGEAFQKLQQDKLLGETVRLMSNDVTAMRDPEAAFARARKMVESSSVPVPAAAPTPGQPVKVGSVAEAKSLPKGTRFIAPDGKTRIVQ